MDVTFMVFEKGSEIARNIYAFLVNSSVFQVLQLCAEILVVSVLLWRDSFTVAFTSELITANYHLIVDPKKTSVIFF